MKIYRTHMALSVLYTIVMSELFIKEVKHIWIVPLAFVTAWVGIFLLIWTVIALISLTIDIGKKYDAPNKFYTKLLNYGYSYIFALAGARVKVSGLEKVPKDQKYLIISNHRSNFDNMVQSYYLRSCPIAYISKQSNFKIPIGRRFIIRNCYLSIDRESPLKSLRTINEATKMVESGITSIGIFPEGRRSKDKNLGNFKAGFLRIASNSGCPILITTISGTEKIHKHFPFLTRVYFDVLGVLTKEDYEGLDPAELSERIREMMQANLIKREGTVK